MKKNIFILICVISFTLTYAQKQYKKFRENGNLEVIGQFDGKGGEIGVWKYYYEEGNIERIEIYRDGKIYNKSYWKNGVLSEISSSENGLFFGKTTMFYDDGKLWSKTKFNKKGQFDGPSKSYHQNGKLKSVQHYQNGENIKNVKIYHENGKISIFAKYDNGISIYEEMYNDNGQKYKIEEIQIAKDDSRIKIVTYIDYHENGKIEKIEKYIDGEPNGECMFYNESGKLIRTEKC